MFGISSITGIDIGSTEIKLVELSGTSKQQVKNIAIAKLPLGLIEQGQIKDEAQLLAQLRQLLKAHKMRIRGRKIALALGGSAVIIRMVMLPNKGEVELSDLIELEAEQHFQHDLSELYFTWQILSSAPDSPEVPVVLVGAKKTVVDQYIATLKKLGCKVRIIDCDVFAQLNMLEFNYGVLPGVNALASIAAAATQITFFTEGRYLYSREIPFGSNNYLNAIAETLAITPPQAEALLVTARENPAAVNGSLLTAITLSNETLAHEIRLTIDFFFQSVPLPPRVVQIDQLFLAGAIAYTFGLQASLSGSLVPQTSIVDPFAKIEVPEALRKHEGMRFAAQFDTAVGLALRHDAKES
jgi:type IV pilus assembly protein PilM